MAIQSFNSLAGFSVGESNTLVIDDNNNVIGNIGTFNTVNVANSITSNNITATGTVTANYIFSTGNITGAGIVTAGESSVGNIWASGIVQGANVVANNTVTASTITANNIGTSANITAGQYFIGDGSLLVGIAPTVQVYEFANIISTGGYYEAVWLGDYTAGNVANVSATVSTTPTLIGSFVTQPGYPNSTVIPIGSILVRAESIKASGNRSYTLYADIYKRSSGGAETLIGTTDSSSSSTLNTRIQQNLISYIDTPVPLLTTDQIVVKIYASVGGSTATIAINFDDNTGSGIQLPALPPSISTFVPYSGATGNIDIDGHSFSSNANISTTNLIATTANVSGVVSAGFLYGDGSNITNLAASYSNANVANYLPVYSGNISANVLSANAVSITGNLSIGNLQTASISGNASSNSNIIFTSSGINIGANGSPNIVQISTAGSGAATFTLTDPDGAIFNLTNSGTGVTLVANPAQGINVTGGGSLPLSAGNSNVRVYPNGAITMNSTGVSNVVLVSSTGANITGTTNVATLAVTGNATVSGTGSNLTRRAYGLVAADTYVTLDDISANVTSGGSQLGLFTSGSWQGTGWTETFQSGTPSVQQWVNLPLSTGYSFASGAMNNQGNGCRCIISDQTPSAKVYQITVVRSGTSGAMWNISIERLV